VSNGLLVMGAAGGDMAMDEARDCAGMLLGGIMPATVAVLALC